MHVTDWNLDPWTGGAYSTLAVGGTPAHRAALGELIDNRLCLAGEHVSVAHPATMHGAYNTGVAAAQQVLATHRAKERKGTAAVVIGAGLAGLAAAQTLRQGGFHVTVLEATSCLGGRARTQTMANGVMIHPGAAWIHGSIGNPIAMMTDQLNIKRIDPWPLHTTHHRAGAFKPTLEEVNRIEHEKERILEILRPHPGAHKTEDICMRSPLSLALETIVDRQLRAAVKVRLDLHFESLMAADLDNLSAWFGDEPYSYPGGDQYITSSLAPMTNLLSEGLDIRFASPARTVRLHDDRVEIQCADYSLTADVCVVAVPLGPLQNGGLTFEPPLPSTHSAALELLTMGNKCKVYIQFSQRWWGDADQMWIYPEHPTETHSPTESALWIDVSQPSNVPMLCGFLGGAAAERAQAESLTEAGRQSLLQRALTALHCVDYEA
jgi:monoamine oxidase